MTRPLTPHGLWLAPPATHLVRAAVRADRAAFDAWLRARPLDDPAALAAAERRLLPLVAARLGGDHPLLGHGARLRDETAAVNRRVVAAVVPAVAALAGGGVAVMALKGLPLLVEHYRDLGLRPMSDVDLLVAPSDLPRALELLARAGWHAPAPPPPGLRRYMCAVDLVHAGGAKLDLHQYLTEHGSTPAAERGLWRRAHPLVVDGVTFAAPGATDLLLQVCLGALKAGRFANSRWMPDAMQLMAGPIDWSLLLDEARLRRVELPLRECLQLLVDELDAGVPAATLDALWRVRPTAARRRRYRVLTRYPAGRAQLAEEYCTLYSFGCTASNERRGPLRFARFAWLLANHRWALQRLNR